MADVAVNTLLSKKTDYALLILSHLHGRDGGGSAREIAERFGLSKPFLANILKELTGKGFLVGHRGVKGGYTLRRPAEDVSLAELIEAMEDGWKLTTCTGQGEEQAHDCSLHNLCPIRGPLENIHRSLVAVLRGVTLAEVFRPVDRTTTFQPVLSVLNARVPAVPERV